jgi:hypothetical protein
MPNLSSAFRRSLDSRGGVALFAFVLLLASTFVHSQTAVVLAPLPQLQFFDQTGTPLAFGCVFTYQVNSTSPLSTYTDYTGVTQNPNPVILTAGGSANIWLQAGQAYTFVVRAAGGSKCAAGSTLYTVNGIGGGSTTLTTIVPYSPTPAFQVAAQNQLFEITLTGNASAQPMTFVGVTPPSYITFQITQDSSGGHTWSWPANSVGGCTIGSGANQVTTQQFVYNGTNATAIGPCVTGNGPQISAAGIYDYDLSSPPAIVCVDADFHLNTSCGSGALTEITVNGQVIPAGGSGNVNAGAAAHTIALNEGNGSPVAGLALALNQFPAGQTSADPIASTIPACSVGTHLFFGGTLPLTCTSDHAVLAQYTPVITNTVSVSSNTVTTWNTQVVTMPSTGCPCRVLASYGVYWNTGGASSFGDAWVTDGTNQFATSQTAVTSATTTGQNGTGLSLGTAYANSAVVTFSAQIDLQSGGTVEVGPAQSGGTQASWMNLVVLPSIN